nr:retrovirus-related Pol polyprotein from transposon TNT 1-94 [Tanacetum cinerariifolium]
MALGYQNPFYLKQAQKIQQSLYDGKVLLEKHDPPIVHDSEETLQLAQESRQKMKQLNKEIKPATYAKINHLSGVFVSQMAKSREELYFSDISKTANVSIPNEEFLDDTTPNVARKFLNEEAVKFVGDFKSLAKEDDESLAKHKALELEIECLLRAVKLKNENEELEFQVLNYAKENSHLKTTYKNLFDSIYVSRIQTKTIIAPMQYELQNTIYENAKLRTQLFNKVSVQKENKRGTRTDTKFAKQLILGKPPMLGETHALSKPVTSNSNPTPQESKVVKNDKVIAPGMFRINPFKTSREEKHVPNTARASARTKPIIVSQPPVFTKKDVNSDSNGLSSTGVDNTKTRRPQPRRNTKNDRVPSASKSSQTKNKEVEVKEHHRNLLLSKKTNGKCFNQRKEKETKAEVKKPKKVGFIERLATPKPSKPISFLRWSLTRRLFDLKGKIIASSQSESQSDCSKGDNACTSNTLEPKIKRFPNSTYLLRRNDHVPAILGFGDLQWGNILITRVYFVERLGHNLFSVGQFCDLDLEVAFRRNACFVRNLEGVDLFKGYRKKNLCIINLHDMASASPICLMARASSTKSWLWHQHLSHLNFDTMNDLAKNDLISGLPKFKYHKEHLCPLCEQEKSKRASHPAKLFQNSRQRLLLLHMDLCGPIRIASINRKRVGISHQVSSVRTPQQNGVVEHRNRTLVEAARTMLIFSRAPLFLWAEAIATACFTQNLDTATCSRESSIETHNWASSAHQEFYKIVREEIFPIVNQVNARLQNFELQFLKEAAKYVGDFKSLAKEADASLAKHKILELDIERLLKAVVSQDIISVVQNASVVDTSDLQTELERTKERFENCIIKKETEYAKLSNDWYKKCDECKYDKISYDKAYKYMQQKIERLQAQLGDLKGKYKDTSCVSDTQNQVFQKLENANVELEFQVFNYARENAHLKTTYKNLFDSISVSRVQTETKIASLQNELQSNIYKNAKLRTQLFKKVSDQKDNTHDSCKNTKFAKQQNVEILSKIGKINALSKPVTSNSVSTPQEPKGVNNDKVITPGMFRISPDKVSREAKKVPNTLSASSRTKPITVS